MKRQKTRNNDYDYTKLSKDSDDEELELFVRKKFQEVATVEKIIEEGDTLQSLSIRYHCPIAELKRLNNIHKENEIFARNSIKVPAKLMLIAGVHSSGNTSPKHKQKPENPIDSNELIHTLTPLESNLNTVIFNSNIATNKYCDNPEEETNIDAEINLLPTIPETVPQKKHWLACSDSDISWITLTLCIVILIFAVPLIYVLYIAEHPEEFHHKHT
ncbi:PREDICTED: lysM and putative peptidoglycan-binding domain-containing protein 3 [Nicrophorus vespilloides]|uniref:LysM and putative peptidoglycan-binding domain-containing protein 3 n=1 Tax=Nicrophorus vespilloides TaxID=110193 RepID=A0ABM1MUM4_NICVS|nr:PREDICTED: lysM and putative peptidoglycan-binding domain-containing protein 3 [Nicrophorus vespilloides]